MFDSSLGHLFEVRVDEIRSLPVNSFITSSLQVQALPLVFYFVFNSKQCHPVWNPTFQKFMYTPACVITSLVTFHFLFVFIFQKAKKKQCLQVVGGDPFPSLPLHPSPYTFPFSSFLKKHQRSKLQQPKYLYFLRCLPKLSLLQLTPLNYGLVTVSSPN